MATWTWKKSCNATTFFLKAQHRGKKKLYINVYFLGRESHFREDLILALVRVGGFRLSVSSSVLDDDRETRPRRLGDGDVSTRLEVSPAASAIATSLELRW